jgi:hypothetical protein
LSFCVLRIITSLTSPSRTVGEKEQLIQEHRKALDAQKAVTRGLKDDLIQIGLRHDQELKDAKAAAEAQLKEALYDSVNSTAVLLAELEEGGKARKAAEDRAALLEAEQKEYDLLVMQTDALALSKLFLFLFRLLLISLHLPVACPYLFSFVLQGSFRTRRRTRRRR